MSADFGMWREIGECRTTCRRHVADITNIAVKALHAAEGCNVKFMRGQCYVGGFVGGKAEETVWMTPQVDKCVQGVKALARVAWRYPQTADL